MENIKFEELRYLMFFIKKAEKGGFIFQLDDDYIKVVYPLTEFNRVEIIKSTEDFIKLSRDFFINL